MDPKQQEHDVSQVFRFQDQPDKNYGKRTGLYIGHADPNKMKNGFARWSDYISYNSDEISIAREDEENTSLYITREPEPDQDVVEIAPPISAPVQTQTNKPQRRNSIKTSRLSERAPKKEAKPEEQKGERREERKSVVGGGKTNQGQYFVDVDSGISGIKSQMKPADSPFAADNISDVKKRESVNTARTSEQFLFELLQDDKGKGRPLEDKPKPEKDKEEEGRRKQKEEPMVIQKQKGKIKQKDSQGVTTKHKEEPMVIEKQKIMDRNRVTDRGSRPKETPMVIEKEKKTNERDRHGIYKQRQEQPLLEAKEDQRKSKRVTINDKGKIKLPNESISTDFEYVLPPDLRQHQTTGKKRPREEVIEQQEEEELQQPPNKQERQEEEPMDIVQSVVEETKSIQRKVEVKPNEDEQKVVITKARRKQPQRIHEGKASRRSKSNRSKPESQQNIENKSDPKQTQKEESQTRPSRPSRPKKIVSDQTNLPKRSMRMLGQLKKVRKIDTDEAVEPHWEPVSANTQRPKRLQVTKLCYWQNLKVVYTKNGKPMGVSGISAEIYLEMIGCTKPQAFLSENIFACFSTTILRLKVSIKPKQRVDFSGINFDMIERVIANDSENFQELEMVKTGTKDARRMKIEVDGRRKSTLHNPVVIRKDQFFTLENLNEARPFEILFTLRKTTQSQ